MQTRLHFRGGSAGALLPVLFFLGGVLWLALNGAPDERGFWPVLLGALALSMLLSRDRQSWSDTVIAGMAQPVVALMILAWMLAGVLGTALAEAGLVQSLVWLTQAIHLGPAAFAGAAFLVCVAVSTATGTSFGTILVAGPLLYPAGVTIGVDPAVLIGAILAGATWGDSISPVSDTSIASAGSQHTDVPGTVRARLRYAVPAGLVALGATVLLAAARTHAPAASSVTATGSARALVLLLSPVLVLVLLMRGRQLLEGLLLGILLALVLGLTLGLIEWGDVMRIDRAAYSAKGLVVDGMARGVGVSVFTLLLMGLVATVQAAGVLDRLGQARAGLKRSAASAEWFTVGTVSAALLLTTHSVVSILAVGPLVKDVGSAAGLGPYRRANLLDLTACTWPFLLPWFLPTILAAGVSTSGEALGVPRVSPLTAGMFNTYAWALLITIPLAIVTGYGRHATRPPVGEVDG